MLWRVAGSSFSFMADRGKLIAESFSKYATPVQVCQMKECR
jgi:hypothetical protein